MEHFVVLVLGSHSRDRVELGLVNALHLLGHGFVEATDDFPHFFTLLLLIGDLSRNVVDFFLLLLIFVFGSLLTRFDSFNFALELSNASSEVVAQLINLLFVLVQFSQILLELLVVLAGLLLDVLNEGLLG